jgi:16S rRNA (guanine527-N7)-methyltransferase
VSAATPATERDQAEIESAIHEIFADRTPLAAEYAELLVTDGIERGMIGPREADRVWERHLINSAVIAPLIPVGAHVIDLGSGAGLPGIPLAIARPDLRVTLLEPMQRRVRFLHHCLASLDLPAVSVHHGRAEDGIAELADVVVVRAVASLDKTMRLSFGLLIDNGLLLALKGSAAAGELEQVRQEMTVDAVLLTLPAPGQSATVVQVRRPQGVARIVSPTPKPSRRKAAARGQARGQVSGRVTDRRPR